MWLMQQQFRISIDNANKTSMMTGAPDHIKGTPVRMLLFAAMILVSSFSAAGTTGYTGLSDSLRTAEVAPDESEERIAMRIGVTANGTTIVFELNESRAAMDLYAQLPLEVDVKDYGDIEKIFYPPDKLDTAETPMADARSGTLAYYAPWGNVVIFYDRFGSASGLYELGHVVSGAEHIQGLSGTVEVRSIESESRKSKEL